MVAKNRVGEIFAVSILVLILASYSVYAITYNSAGGYCNTLDSEKTHGAADCGSGLVCAGRDNTHISYVCMPSSIPSGRTNIESKSPDNSNQCTGSYLEVALNDGGAMYNSKYPSLTWTAYSGTYTTQNYFCGVTVYGAELRESYFSPQQDYDGTLAYLWKATDGTNSWFFYQNENDYGSYVGGTKGDCNSSPPSNILDYAICKSKPSVNGAVCRRDYNCQAGSCVNYVCGGASSPSPTPIATTVPCESQSVVSVYVAKCTSYGIDCNTDSRYLGELSGACTDAGKRCCKTYDTSGDCTTKFHFVWNDGITPISGASVEWDDGTDGSTEFRGTTNSNGYITITADCIDSGRDNLKVTYNGQNVYNAGWSLRPWTPTEEFKALGSPPSTSTITPTPTSTATPSTSPGVLLNVLDFSASGGTLDGGSITASESPHTWTVNLPSNFAKVETAHYDKNTPSTIKKYMGWYGSLKANGDVVWEFKSWSSSTGGLIYDYTLNQEVKESTGTGLWIDVTSLFHSGSNTVVFSHDTAGDGIGLKIRVTALSCLGCSGESPTPTSTPWGAGECNGDSDCKINGCSNCDAGQQICSAGKCVDCTYDGHCKSGGYNCENKKCVKKEEKPIAKCGNGICDSNEDCSNCPADCFTDKRGACVQTDGKWVLCKYNTKEKYGQYCCDGKMQKEQCGGAITPSTTTSAADDKLSVVLHGNANYLNGEAYEYPTTDVKLSLFVKNGLQSNVKGYAKLFVGENTLLAKKPFWIKQGAEQYIDIDFTGKEGESYDSIDVDLIYRKGDEEKSSVKSASPIKIKIKGGWQQFQKLSLAEIIGKQKKGETGVYKTEVIILNRIFANQQQLKQGFSLLGLLLGGTTPFDMINWIMENIYGRLYLVAGRTGKSAPALLLDQYGTLEKADVKEGDIIEVVLDTEFLDRKLNPGTFLVGVSKADHYISKGYSMSFVNKLNSKPLGKLKDAPKSDSFEGYGFIIARKMDANGKASYLLSDMGSEQWVVWEGGNAPTFKLHTLVSFKAGVGAADLYLNRMDGIGDYETEQFKDSEKKKAVSIGFGSVRYGFIKDYYTLSGDSSIGPALFKEYSCKIMWGVADLAVLYSSDSLQEGAKAIASSWERATDTDTSRGLKKYLSAFASSNSPTKDSVEAKKSGSLGDADKQKNIIYITDSPQDKLYEQIKDRIDCSFNSDDSCFGIITSPFSPGKYIVVILIKKKDAAYTDSGWKGLARYLMPVAEHCPKFRQALSMNQDYYFYKNGDIV